MQPSAEHHSPSPGGWRLTGAWLLAAALILALLPFVYTGWFARYQADDYCAAQLLREEGFWRAQWLSYTGWSNRFATMLVTGLLDPLDVTGMQILPGLLTAGLLGAAVLLLFRLRALTGARIPGAFLWALAAGGVFLGLYTLPERFQALYWRSGSVTYTLPAVCLLLLLAALTARPGARRGWRRAALLGLFSFFAAGFSETTAAVQITVLALGLAAILVFAKAAGPGGVDWSGWAAALVGALAALIVMILAPGNAVRMGQMPPPPGFFAWLGMSLRHGAAFLADGLSSYLLPRAAGLVLGLGLALLQDWSRTPARRLAWTLLAVPTAACLLAVAACAPSAYAQSAYPEPRALSMANFILTGGVIAAGWLIGGLIQKGLAGRLPPGLIRAAAVAGLLIVGAYALYAGWRVLGEAAEYRARAAAWDDRAAQIEQLRLGGAAAVEVEALDSIGSIAELSADPEDWVNRCAAGYYGVEEIRGR